MKNEWAIGVQGEGVLAETAREHVEVLSRDIPTDSTLLLLSSGMFVSTWIIVSFSSSLLIAVIRVIAANAFEETRSSPLSRCNALVHTEVLSEQCGGTALVPIGEQVVLQHELEQMCRFPLNAPVAVLTGESLLLLVEIVQLQGGDLTAHAAQVVAAPPKRAVAGQANNYGVADEAAILAGTSDVSYRDALQDVLAACTALGLEAKWRSVGASIRFKTPDRNQPLSIGWLVPAGSHWQGARFLTFGVDPDSLASTPSVVAAVLRGTARLAEIPGAVPVPTSLDASTFGQDVLPAVSHQLIGVLKKLVKDLAESDDRD